MPSIETSITIDGITCWDEGLEETYDIRGKSSGAVRTVRCAWTNRRALGTAFATGAANVYPADDKWFATSINVKGEGLRVANEIEGGMIGWQYAVLTVKYGPKDEESNGGPLDIGGESLDFSSFGLALSQDESSFKWDDGSGDDVPTGLAPSIRVSTVAFVKEVKNVDVLPTDLVIATLDHTNSDLIFGAAPGTLLYQGAQSSHRILLGGVDRWDLGHRMEYNPRGWNKLYKPDVGWTAFKFKADNSDPFPPAPFAALFA